MTTPIYIDPFHDILRGSTLEYATESTNNGSRPTTVTRFVSGDDDVDTGTENYGPAAPAGATLSAPTNLQVKARNVRFAPDGSQVVDLVLTVDNVPGAERYEVRISKE